MCDLLSSSATAASALASGLPSCSRCSDDNMNSPAALASATSLLTVSSMSTSMLMANVCCITSAGESSFSAAVNTTLFMRIVCNNAKIFFFSTHTLLAMGTTTDLCKELASVIRALERSFSPPVCLPTAALSVSACTRESTACPNAISAKWTVV